MIDTGIVTALIAGAVSIAVAGLSLVGARSAQKSTAALHQRQAEAEQSAAADKRERAEAQARAVVEAQAYQRARDSYERIVKDLEAQLDRNQKTVERVQTQLDLVMGRLATEQDVSNTLRSQIRTLQDRIAELQRENDRFRETFTEHQRVAGTLDSELRRAGVALPGQ